MANIIMCSWGQMDGAQSNMGDIVIFESMVATIRRIDPQSRIVAFSSDPDGTRRQYGIQAFDVFTAGGATRFASELARADLVLLGGGELVQDRSSKAYLLFNLAPGLASSILRRPFVGYAIGVSGPEETSPAGRRLTRLVLNRAAAITVRDEPSKEYLARYGVQRPSIQLTADAAFQLGVTNDCTWMPGLEATGLDLSRPYAVFAVRSFGHRSGAILPGFVKRRLGLGIPAEAKAERKRLTHELARIVDHVADRHHLQILLLPAQQKSRVAFDDTDFCDQVAQATKQPERIRILRRPTSARCLIEYLRQATILVGVPLHSLILASIAHTPMLALCYASKGERFMNRIKMDRFAVDLYRSPMAPFPTNRIMALADELMRERTSLSAHIAKAHRELTQQADANEAMLRRLLDSNQ
ncbi:MAG: polysaccharide pyruvyl transferase family protein [Deltaproteobacteria bacterium]|nr:polysaccharide pyruvyl transferase family protein [Deltaproteobacteria bacterium]